MTLGGSIAMGKQVLGSVLEQLPSSEDRMRFLESMSVVTSSLSRRIIAKAASPNSPVSIGEFPDINETAMARCLHQLQQIGILSPVWEDNQRKFAITDLGKEIDKILSVN